MTDSTITCYLILARDDRRFTVGQRPDGSLCATYANHLQTGDNVLVAYYDDADFFRQVYDARGIDLYSDIEVLPKLYVITAVDGGDRFDPYTDHDILSVHAVFTEETINGCMFPPPPPSSADASTSTPITATTKFAVRYMPDNRGKTVSRGFIPLSTMTTP